MGHHRKTVVLTLLCILSVITVLFIFYSFLNPYAKLGYRTVIYDNTAKVNKLKKDFRYSRYTFNIAYSEPTKEADDLFDCSNLLVGGIFNPSADSASASQNWWPKEDCKKKNKQRTDKAAQSKVAIVSYTITNNSNSVGEIPANWLSISKKDGTTLFSSNDKITISPMTTVRGAIKKDIGKNIMVSNATIRLPGLAVQSVLLK